MLFFVWEPSGELIVKYRAAANLNKRDLRCFENGEVYHTIQTRKGAPKRLVNIGKPNRAGMNHKFRN